MSILGKIFDTGVAYLQHTNFVQTACEAAPEEVGDLLVNYVQGLSGASFLGFTTTLAMLGNQEGNSHRKGVIQYLLENADAARALGQNGSEVKTIQHEASGDDGRSSGPLTTEEDLLRDCEMIDNWYQDLSEDQCLKALATRLKGMNTAGYARFKENLRIMKLYAADKIKEHNETEHHVLGTSIEDRMAYLYASVKTGERDGEFMRQLRELENRQGFVEWIDAISAETWKGISK